MMKAKTKIPPLKMLAESENLRAATQELKALAGCMRALALKADMLAAEIRNTDRATKAH